MWYVREKDVMWYVREKEVAVWYEGEKNTICGMWGRRDGMW